MIALKLAGCACIIACSAMWCVRYGAALHARITSLERVTRFISLCRREIEYYETRFPMIVQKFVRSEGLVLPPSANTNEDAADECAATAICDGLDSADAERFLAFFSQIGAGFSETEIRLCDEAALYFVERLTELRADFSRKRRVNSSLTLFAAISVCILIL